MLFSDVCLIFHIQFNFTFFPSLDWQDEIILVLFYRCLSWAFDCPTLVLSAFLILNKVWRKTLCFQQDSVQQRLPADQTTTWVLMLRLRSPSVVPRVSVYKSRIIQMINHKLEVLFTQLFTT